MKPQHRRRSIRQQALATLGAAWGRIRVARQVQEITMLVGFFAGASPRRAVRALALPLTLALSATLLSMPVHAADTPEPAPAARDPLAQARSLIADKKWTAAVDALKKVNNTRSADWNNLMGYSLRKLATPDLAGAERHYNEALRIDPRHLGALEYVGELHLMMGDLAKAETRLATLASACNASCEEYKDLKGMVDQFKANGNKYVAKP
jgi:Flp pilus assembly protein TadD